MPASIRVRLTPLESLFGDADQAISDGALISLTVGGAPGSQLEPPAEPKPAKLKLEARFFARADSDGEGDEKRPLAWIEGKLARERGVPAQLTFRGKLGDDGKPVGLTPEDDPNDPDDPALEERVFRFRFDSQFQNVAEVPGAGDLRVLLDPKKFHYCEVSATLEIDGAEEAASAANDTLDVLITKRNPAGSPVRRARLVGMLFDANKCFLLPQALPGILTIVAMHREHPDAQVLIVGHAGGDEDLASSDLALDRAKIVGAYLTSKPGEWVKWFGKDKPARSRWGTREVQLMLSALPAGEEPFYIGYASGVTDEQTTTAVKRFQASKQLPTNGQADGATIKAILEAYLALEDTTLSQDITPVAHGCEGHFDDDVTEAGLVPDDRRLEVFFFDGKIRPKPQGDTSAQGSQEYPAWRRRLVETRDFEHHGIHVQIVDDKQQPVPLAEVHLEGPVIADAVADDHGFVSFFGLTAGDYFLNAKSKGIKIGKFPIRYPTAKTVPGFAKTDAVPDPGASPTASTAT